MAASAYFKTVTVSSTEWRPLAEKETVVRAAINVWAAMSVSQPLKIRFNGGSEASINKSGQFELDGVDLSLVEVKGQGSYRVTVLGYSR